MVDDNATNRRVLEQYLMRWGMDVVCTEDGPQALAAMEQAAKAGRPFDAALLDEGMPEMDGIELARRIKGDPTLAGTRLILLSSYGKRLDNKALAAVGVEAFLSKPLRQSKLYDCLATVMWGRGEHGGAEAEPTGDTSVRAGKLGDSASSLDPERRALRLLLVEDNQVNQAVATAMLESFGYQVEVADHGREALDLVERHDYAAVLMDCQMPEMDGYEATRAIREREASHVKREASESDTRDASRTTNDAAGPRRLPIIAMTANAMTGDRGKCLEAGMDDYVTKPIKMEELAAVLKKWTAPSATSGEMRAAA